MRAHTYRNDRIKPYGEQITAQQAASISPLSALFSIGWNCKNAGFNRASAEVRPIGQLVGVLVAVGGYCNLVQNQYSSLAVYLMSLCLQ